MKTAKYLGIIIIISVRRGSCTAVIDFYKGSSNIQIPKRVFQFLFHPRQVMPSNFCEFSPFTLRSKYKSMPLKSSLDFIK